MTKNEALHLMIDGKKVKPVAWSYTAFLQWKKGKVVNSAGHEYDITDTSDTTWEIHEEPKTIEKVEVVYFKSNHGSISAFIKGSEGYVIYSNALQYTEVTI